MGGMAVLEWPLCTPKGYVRNIIPLATSARHSAWCISWGEAQRQSIYSDPAYQNGYYCYDEQGGKPEQGLAAARMSALLTYRSRDSFESRFGRKAQARRLENGHTEAPAKSASVFMQSDNALAAHNDGNRSMVNGKASPTLDPPTPVFSAQSYLRYQGDKFTARFDANCYIHITRKMDTHDLARGRASSQDSDTLHTALSMLPPSLIISIETDGLFTTSEQTLLATHIPHSELVLIPSPDGHDGFLLEFEAINGHVLRWLKTWEPDLYVGGADVEQEIDGFEVQKTSLFGEAEKDITSW
jgi:homoserine O-acetyltransferase